jgi:hypothetical protein
LSAIWDFFEIFGLDSTTAPMFFYKQACWLMLVAKELPQPAFSLSFVSGSVVMREQRLM